mmetsp:Transcript_1912/g.5902  ORF Transcript_1912/g.5902 Transcript_1912/m.5902 type:complete len:240 (+) Transcript_1912:142-861(+)
MAIKRSRDARFVDAAEFADETKSCCMLPLRWGTFAFAALFLAAGAIQCFEGVYLEIKNGKTPQQLLGGTTGESIVIVMAVCMALSGASGFLGALFQIRFPVTLFCLLLLLQVCLEIAWLVVVEGTEETKSPLYKVAKLLFNEILRGSRAGGSTFAGHLFYTFFSVQFHLWAASVTASYALELRIEGKAEWFEPVLDDSDGDEEAPLLGKEKEPPKEQEGTPAAGAPAVESPAQSAPTAT